MTKNDNNNLFTKLLLSCSSSGIAELITVPFDALKVNMQVATFNGKNNRINEVVRRMWQNDGFRGFYNSWFVSTTRQITMTGIRIGMYDHITTKVNNDNYFQQISTAAFCALCANVISMPFDVMKIKMQNEPKKYNTTINTIKNIYNIDKIRGFYVGFIPTVQRAMLISGIQLPVYFNLQNKILPNYKIFNDNLWLKTTTASISTTLVVTAFVYPIDVCKSIIMSQTVSENKNLTSLKILQRIKIANIYRGFSVSLSRAVPQFLIMTNIYETMKNHLGCDAAFV